MTFKNEEVFRSNFSTVVAGVGGAILFFGLASIYAGFDNKISFFIVGDISVIVGFAFLGWGLSLNKKYFGRIIPSKDQVFSFRPVRNDYFTIVIDGVGSFGNRENQANADVIAKRALEQLIEGGAMIRAARFYSRNGSDNLLFDFQDEKEKGEG